MIDPLAKLNRPPRKRDKPKKLKRKRRKRGSFSASEKLIVAEIVRDAPLNVLNEKQIEATSIMLRRSPEAIQSIVTAARERLQSNALHYVDSHRKAIDQALALQDNDVARKGSEWAMEHVSFRDADGKVERIVDRVEAEESKARITIGIALGGLRKPT